MKVIFARLHAYELLRVAAAVMRWSPGMDVRQAPALGRRVDHYALLAIALGLATLAGNERPGQRVSHYEPAYSAT